MKHAPVNITLPSWLATCALDSSLRCKDVAPMLGMTVRQLYYAVDTGRFPAPDFKAGGISMKNKTFYWKVSTVIELAKTRGES